MLHLVDDGARPGRSSTTSTRSSATGGGWHGGHSPAPTACPTATAPRSRTRSPKASRSRRSAAAIRCRDELGHEHVGEGRDRQRRRIAQGPPPRPDPAPPASGRGARSAAGARAARDRVVRQRRDRRRHARPARRLADRRVRPDLDERRRRAACSSGSARGSTRANDAPPIRPATRRCCASGRRCAAVRSRSPCKARRTRCASTAGARWDGRSRDALPGRRAMAGDRAGRRWRAGGVRRRRARAGRPARHGPGRRMCAARGGVGPARRPSTPERDWPDVMRAWPDSALAGRRHPRRRDVRLDRRRRMRCGPAAGSRSSPPSPTSCAPTRSGDGGRLRRQRRPGRPVWPARSTVRRRARRRRAVDRRDVRRGTLTRMDARRRRRLRRAHDRRLVADGHRGRRRRSPGSGCPADTRISPICVRDADGQELVIRRPPQGELLPKAHDMWREYRIIKGLWPTAVPVAEPIAYCDDRAVAETHFYVMRKAEGRALYTGAVGARVARRARPRATPVRRSSTCSPPCTRSTPEQVGLGDLGRHDGYVARQLRTWYGSWTASVEFAGFDDPRVHELHDAAVVVDPRAGSGAGRARRLRAAQLAVLARRATSRPCSTGSWRRSAIRSPTSPTRSTRGPRPVTRACTAPIRRRRCRGSPHAPSSTARYAAITGADLSQPRLLPGLQLVEDGAASARRVRPLPGRPEEHRGRRSRGTAVAGRSSPSTRPMQFATELA